MRISTPIAPLDVRKTVLAMFDEMHEELRRLGVRSKKVEETEVACAMLMSAALEPVPLYLNWTKLGFSPAEARIFGLLMSRLGKETSRVAILDAMYFDRESGDETQGEGKTIGVHVYRIREKMRHADIPYRLDRIWGYGFILVPLS